MANNEVIDNGGAGSCPFQCSYCQRSFSRVDHLSRHIRSHTQERPYSCRICGKDFARIDLMKRHTTQHSVNTSNRRLTRKLATQTGRRVNQACKACATSKLKCSDGKPCHRCVRKNLVCIYDSPQDIDMERVNTNSDNRNAPLISRDRGDADEQMLLPAGATVPLMSPGSDETHTQPATMEATLSDIASNAVPDATLTSISQEMHPSFSNIGNQTNASSTLGNLLEFPLDHPNFDIDDAAFNYSQVLKDILDSSGANSLHHEGIMAESDSNIWDHLLDSGQGFTDFADFPFMDITSSNLNHHSPENSRKSAPFEHLASTAATQAFQISGWNWGPSPCDSTSTEAEHLVLPSDCTRSENFDLLPPQKFVLHLRTEDRNRLLSMLLEKCTKEQWVRISSTFPHETILDHLLQRFLSSQEIETLPWFHRTSTIDRMQTVLLAAMVGTGACLTSNMSLQRFGYVMQEMIRYAVVHQWSQDNTTSRNQQLLHSLLTVTTLSMWSGDKRHMEIGEGNYLPTITIIRRARWLRRDQYRYAYPHVDEEGASLQHKWHQWVDKESRKRRLIYRTFCVDAQVSMANQVTPLMSYAEMQIPLPESEEMWWASTAEEWKAAYLRSVPPSSAESLTLAEAVKLAMTESHWSRLEFDRNKILFTVNGLWSLVWEHQRLQETLNSETTATSDMMHDSPGLVLPIRREPLIKALNLLRGRMNTLSEQGVSRCEEPRMALEYLSMLLYVPLQGLQAFAGRDGEQEARRVFPGLQEWIKSRDARQGMWHAGQVYRFAKAHSGTHLRDVRVMLVYQASIVFWVYGVISKASRISFGLQTRQDIDQNGVVYLDGESSATMRKFITTGEGVPAIHKIDGRSEEGLSCPIEDAGATMGIAISILRSTSGQSGVQLGLVNTITKLMTEIAKVAQIL
ncbi:hypothetical protein BS50DRAFT_557290 [Corynespora cassiicola Philippines]|uniref:Uncharacterized protein n=1 Tax=Corynespora cassiicola Philippines TaxID=1448308 RepID=A0A2T2NGT2_CORCC|nr:hypothetical protein BS50DRAFT_557290 [Corynespora cassiicola Philippines]